MSPLFPRAALALGLSITAVLAAASPAFALPWVPPVEDEGEAPKPAPWWAAFQDERLDALIARAIDRNRDLARMAVRLESACATSAGRFDFVLDLRFPFERPFWARVAAMRRARRDAEEASETDFAFQRLTIASAVASHYWNIAALDRQIALAESASKPGGPAALAAAEFVRDLARLRSERADELDAIALLLDEPAASIPVDGARLPQSAALPIASELASPALFRRPDVHAAKLQMEEALRHLDMPGDLTPPALLLTDVSGRVSASVQAILADPASRRTLDTGDARIPEIEKQVVRSQRLGEFHVIAAAYRASVFYALKDIADEQEQRDDVLRQLAHAQSAFDDAMMQLDRREVRGVLGMSRRPEAGSYELEQVRTESVRARDLARGLGEWLAMRKALGGY